MEAAVDRARLRCRQDTDRWVADVLLRATSVTRAVEGSGAGTGGNRVWPCELEVAFELCHDDPDRSELEDCPG